MTRKPFRWTGPIQPISILFIVFIISLILYFATRPNISGRVFRYLTNDGRSIGYERRGIPLRQSNEEQIHVYMQELLVGPITLGLASVVPQGITLRHVAVIDKTAYIDLSSHTQIIHTTSANSFDAIAPNIKNNLFFNFPWLKNIVFLMDGQQFYAPIYQEKSEK